MDEQSKNQTSTDPTTVSVPPAEGRTDIGEGQGGSQQEAANATTAPTDELLSKPPTEGREDIAEDLSQEQEQSYSASKDRAPNPPSTGVQALLLRLHSVRLPNQRIDLLSDKVWGVGCVAKNKPIC